MRLKDYQKQVLEDLRTYLGYIDDGASPGKAFSHYWSDKGIDISALADNTFLHPYDDSVRGVPNVTIKVPTAGGKTFIACNALRHIFGRYPTGRPRVVAWFVPSDEILRQTLRNLRNPTHPYRQCLDSIFNGRVHVLDKEEALRGQGISPVEVMEQVSIFVLSVSSFAANNKEGRKSYRENENLTGYPRLYDSLTARVRDADETSLMQVLAYLQPVVIVDESHNFEANLRVELLNALHPFFILNLTATPKKRSNIISFVDAIQLKRENMVKLPVIVYNHPTVNEVVANAISLRDSLERRAVEAENKGSRYIRPIVLFQAQPRKGEENVTYDKIKETLIASGIPENQVKIKTSERNELKDIDLMDRDCPVRFIITVDALKEGWDCPFAYILASLANRTSRVSVEQILGRVLRLPYTSEHPDKLLNMSYVFTSSRDFGETLDSIIRSLNNAGFSRKDFRKGEVEPEGNVNEVARPDNLFRDIRTNRDAKTLEDGDMPRDGDMPEMDSRHILAATRASSSALASIERHAIQESGRYEDELARTEADRNDVPHDIQDSIPVNRIKDIYPEAAGMMLPRFVTRVRKSTFFEYKDAWAELDKTMLEEGFGLDIQDKHIDFTLSNPEAVSLDLARVSNDNEFEVQRRVLAPEQLAMLKEQFAGMPEDNVRHNVARNIARRIRIDSIPEPEIVRYVSDAISGLDNAKLKDILLGELPYADKVRVKIESLLLNYRIRKFEAMLDTREIRCEERYRFPNSVAVAHEVPGLRGGLYLREGDMNNLEKKVIQQVSSLDNVMFWHRNQERTGFCINGFINHYPDFIVHTKKGDIVLIETKGDDRDNSDSRDKIRLGHLWESKAGERYHYYMVFENKQVDGALTIAELIRRLKQL